jgi:smad nuclear-interacting protein 1
MPADYQEDSSRRRDYAPRDGTRDRKQRRSPSLSNDDGRYRRRDEGKDRSDRHRRDRSTIDSHRRRDRDDDRSHRRRRSRDRSRQKHRSQSPDPKRRRHSKSKSPPPTKSRGPLPSQNDQFRGELTHEGGESLPEKQKPNWKPTGLLAKEANTVAGTSTVLKYHEPAEARKPPAKEQWRMYVFKQKDLLDTVQLYQRSCWLAGRDQNVTDMTLEHPSISKQHAVIQFRFQTTTNEYGDKTNKVKPYLIDLESANGTKLNGKLIATSRYVQLVDQDVISFGDSEREYVMMLPPPA